MTMKIAIVGSREYNNYEDLKIKVDNCLDEWKINKNDVHIISGGARGADTLALKYAMENKMKFTIHRSEWNKYGRAAGMINNDRIVNDSDFMIAFPSTNGKGTQDAIRKFGDKNTENLKIYEIS